MGGGRQYPGGAGAAKFKKTQPTHPELQHIHGSPGHARQVVGWLGGRQPCGRVTLALAMFCVAERLRREGSG